MRSCNHSRYFDGHIAASAATIAGSSAHRIPSLNPNPSGGSSPDAARRAGTDPPVHEDPRPRHGRFDRCLGPRQGQAVEFGHRPAPVGELSLATRAPSDIRPPTACCAAVAAPTRRPFFARFEGYRADHGHRTRSTESTQPTTLQPSADHCAALPWPNLDKPSGNRLETPTPAHGQPASESEVLRDRCGRPLPGKQIAPQHEVANSYAGQCCACLPADLLGGQVGVSHRHLIVVRVQP